MSLVITVDFGAPHVGVPPGSEKKTFEIKKSLTPEDVIAKVLMAARDPEVETLRERELPSAKLSE